MTGDWRDRAECQHYDSELWWPIGQSGTRATGRPGESFKASEAEEAKQAKAICRTCPVQVECLEDAYRTAQRWGFTGVRAGMTEDELQDLWKDAVA